MSLRADQANHVKKNSVHNESKSKSTINQRQWAQCINVNKHNVSTPKSTMYQRQRAQCINAKEHNVSTSKINMSQFDGKYAIRLKCYFLACVVVWRTLTFHCIQNKKAITKKTTLTHTNHKETQTNIVTCTLQAGRGCWTLVCCVPWSDSVCAMPAGFSLSKGAEV